MVMKHISLPYAEPQELAEEDSGAGGPVRQPGQRTWQPQHSAAGASILSGRRPSETTPHPIKLLLLHACSSINRSSVIIPFLGAML